MITGFHSSHSSENDIMAGFAIALFTVILLLVCLFMVIIILMQRSSANAGMGTALGGGAAESVFGGETANVLLKNTVIVAVLFYLLSMGLYLGELAHYRSSSTSNMLLPPAVGAHPASSNSSSPNPLAGKTPAPATAPVPVKFDPKAGNATTAPATTAPAATTSASTTTTPAAAPAAPAAVTTTSSAPASAPAAPAPAP